MDQNQLHNLLLHNVLILSFLRRTDPKGMLRRMICTKSNYILNSFQGQSLLNFFKSKRNQPNFSVREKGLVLVWDIFMQDYRLIPSETAKVIEIIPQLEFWKYFNDVLIPMSTNEKVKFMNH